MSKYHIGLEWDRGDTDFEYAHYSRDHAIVYGDNSRVCASASPDYYGNPSCLNPEQSFLAALAGCHMLTFLAIASKKGFVVDTYRDNCYAELGRNEHRKPAVVKAVLAPKVVFSGEKKPTEEDYHKLHDRAHDACFIANSIAQCVKVLVHPAIG